MDKATFTDTESESQWWLLESVIYDTMVELRRDLSEILGYARDNEWYLERWKVESLYDLLETHDRNLLTDLDTVDDNDQRKAWLESVLAALAPQEEAAPAGPAESPASDASTVAPASSPAAAPAKKRAGIFAKKDEEPPAGDTPGLDEEPPAEDTPGLDASEAVKVVMNGLDDQRIAQLAAELQMAPDEVRALLAQLPEGFEEEVAAEARTIAAQAS